jgi:hypothetical protein
MKNFVIAAMIVLGMVGSSYGGECVNGSCLLRSRVVNVTREVVSVPVTVTRRTVEATRNVGRKAVNRCRSIVR